MASESRNTNAVPIPHLSAVCAAAFRGRPSLPSLLSLYREESPKAGQRVGKGAIIDHTTLHGLCHCLVLGFCMKALTFQNCKFPHLSGTVYRWPIHWDLGKYKIQILAGHCQKQLQGGKKRIIKHTGKKKNLQLSKTGFHVSQAGPEL